MSRSGFAFEESKKSNSSKKKDENLHTVSKEFTEANIDGRAEHEKARKLKNNDEESAGIEKMTIQNAAPIKIEHKEPPKSVVSENTIMKDFPESDLKNEMHRNTVAEPVSEETPTGYIKVVASTGNEAFPISGATVRIYQKNESQIMELISVMQTDRGGSTVSLPLKTENEINSLSPNPPIIPFSLFDISVNAEGFYNLYYSNVMVFENQLTLQNANLIPLSFEDSVSPHPNNRDIIFEGEAGMNL